MYESRIWQPVELCFSGRVDGKVRIRQLDELKYSILSSILLNSTTDQEFSVKTMSENGYESANALEGVTVNPNRVEDVNADKQDFADFNVLAER